MRFPAKWFAFVAALLVLIASMVMFMAAEPVPSLKPTGYVNDFAHVLSPATTSQLTALAQQVDEKAHAQIAVVTVNTLDGRDIESYAVDLFKQWGVGGKKTDRGVLILYAIQDHRARVEVGYGLEPILPDGKVGGFQREAVPLLRESNYNAALLLVTSRVAGVIATDAGVQLTGIQPRPPTDYQRGQPQQGLSLGGLLFMALILIVILISPLRGLLFYMLLGGLGGGGGWGGRGGGGFGGGGGGFGGFGGGSSGGGGASSGW